MIRRVRWLAQPILLALALVGMGLLLRSQWGELQKHTWRLHEGWLALSAAVLLVTWLVEVGMWRYALALVGGRLSFATAVRIWFASALMRYIPGNIWQPLGMAVLCQRQGIRPEATVTSIALYQAVNLLSVLPIGVGYLLGTGNLGLLAGWLMAVPLWLLPAGVVPVLAFLWRPDWLMAGVNLVLRKMGRMVLPVRLSRTDLLAFLAVAVADWLLWGCAFACVTFALGTYTGAEIWNLLPHLVAAYAMAYVAGYLSLLTPGGLAVREGALFVLLAPLLGGGVATVAALAMRLWQVLLEVVVAAGVGTRLLKSGAALARGDPEVVEAEIGDSFHAL